MARMIKSLFGFNSKTATPEEIEAYRVANEALQFRMETMLRQRNTAHVSSRPVTDMFGRAI